jgi:replicative DNA helicase
VVDYLGLVDPPPGRATREQEVSAISAAIKSAARANEVPIIVLAQLNRGVEQREDKRPQLSDLRDSGSLEQDADLVVFVYREEYYLSRQDPDAMTEAKRETWRQDMQRERNRIDIYSAKARQGDLVRRKSFFFGSRQAVRNSDHYKNGGR